MQLFVAQIFTHHVHVAIELPHSVKLYKCFSMVISLHVHIFTHCLQVPHF